MVQTPFAHVHVMFAPQFTNGANFSVVPWFWQSTPWLDGGPAALARDEHEREQ